MNIKRCLTVLMIAVLALSWAGMSNTTEPRGIRNNNPLNIRDTGDEWNGQVVCDDREFVCFDSPVSGIRAATIILHNYHHLHHIDNLYAVVERWSPPTENDTNAIYRLVTDQMEEVSRVGPKNLNRLLEALILSENGIQPYNREVIKEGINNALSNRDTDSAWFRIDGRDNEVSRNEAGD